MKKTEPLIGKMKKKNIRIGNFKIGNGQPVFIIAEAGVNHNGSLKLAKRLVDAAKEAGADAIKFQAFRAADLVTNSALQAVYQRQNGKSISQLAMLKALELSETDFKKLYSYCAKKKIAFLATPFDDFSLKLLNCLGVAAYKVSSGDLTNIPLLSRIAAYNKPVILSTGMSNLKEIGDAVKSVAAVHKQMVLLHCTSCYPTRFSDVNLRAMNTMWRTFNLPIGYSDHTLGIEIPIAAVTMGACVIEKHLTLDRGLPGPDQQASLEPVEFKAMVKAIRNVELALGEKFKSIKKCEQGVRLAARKSVVSTRSLPKGEKLTMGMLTIKRPGSGIAPKYLKQLVGRRLKQAVQQDTVLTWKKLL